MRNLYVLVDRETKSFLSDATFERDTVRARKQQLKLQGLDPVIIASKIDREQSRIIR